MRIDKLIERLTDEKISKKEKLRILDEIELEIYEFELPGGYFYYLKNTAPHDCYKFYYDFYLQKLTNQPTQSHPSQ